MTKNKTIRKIDLEYLDQNFFKNPKQIHKYKPVVQDKSLTINYSTKKDFNSTIVKNFRKFRIPKFSHDKYAFVRPSILKHK